MYYRSRGLVSSEIYFIPETQGFYSADGTNKCLFDVINKHKDNEKFLYPCSESFDSEITNWLKMHNCEYATPVLYKIVSNDIKEVIGRNYDLICFFTPGGVKA